MARDYKPRTSYTVALKLNENLDCQNSGGGCGILQGGIFQKDFWR